MAILAETESPEIWQPGNRPPCGGKVKKGATEISLLPPQVGYFLEILRNARGYTIAQIREIPPTPWAKTKRVLFFLERSVGHQKQVIALLPELHYLRLPVAAYPSVARGPPSSPFPTAI